MKNITVIGAGEVFFNRYLPALMASPSKSNFAISDIIDLANAIDVSTKIRNLYPSINIRTHALQSVDPLELFSLLEQNSLTRSPILVSTPTNFHVPYASILLSAGMSVCIEKPLAATSQHLYQLDSLLNQQGFEKLFLFGYYALEKGLPLLIFARSGLAPHNYIEQLFPCISAIEISDLRNSLGSLRRIRGVLLETTGQAGSLNNRAWVLDPVNGGNTVETFYHLICLTLPFFNQNEYLSISNVSLGVDRKTDIWYRKEYGRAAAETYTSASLISNTGVEISLACAKYVPVQMNQRWISIDFDEGFVFMDLEASVLSVESKTGSYSIGLKSNVKYETQFILWSQKLHNPSMYVEYDLFRRALLLTLSVRSKGDLSLLRSYDEDILAKVGLERVISANF